MTIVIQYPPLLSAATFVLTTSRSHIYQQQNIIIFAACYRVLVAALAAIYCLENVDYTG